MALKLGIQMYSVRHSFDKDPVGTLKKIGEIGYKYIEFADVTYADDMNNNFKSGFAGAGAEEIRAAVNGAGCVILGSHVYPFDRSNMDRILDYHAQLGSKYLISKTSTRTREEDLRACELYNELGERCRAVGIQHVIHTGIPHYNDRGEWILDVLAENTAPENLMYELDTYWCLRSDHDVIETIKKFADRIIFIHQKDLPKDFSGRLQLPNAFEFFDCVNREDFIEIGEGQIDHQAMIDATVKYTKATHIILEQDFTKLDEIESIRVSMENFKRMNHIEID